jgi:hypothetical protein
MENLTKPIVPTKSGLPAQPYTTIDRILSPWHMLKEGVALTIGIVNLAAFLAMQTNLHYGVTREEIERNTSNREGSTQVRLVKSAIDYGTLPGRYVGYVLHDEGYNLVKPLVNYLRKG